MKIGRYLSISILLVIVIIVGIGLGFETWRGGGFSADGPEMPRLRQVLKVAPGMSIADVGAGSGDLTLALAAEVGSDGRVFSSDIDPNALEEIRGRIAAAGLRNVTVVQAAPATSGLPSNCCDAVVLRRVYHHLSDPAAINVDLLRAMRPGAVLLVIDFPPTFSWLWPWPPRGVPENRHGHGIVAATVVGEVTASGFELVQVFDDWPGRGPLGSYCAVFRKAGNRTIARRQGPRSTEATLADGDLRVVLLTPIERSDIAIGCCDAGGSAAWTSGWPRTNVNNFKSPR